MSADESEEINGSRIHKVTNPQRTATSRRTLLRQMAGVSLGVPLAQWTTHPLLAQADTSKHADPPQNAAPQAPGSQNTGQPAPGPHMAPAPAPVPSAISPQDDQFLDEVERASFLFFWEQT